MGVYGDLFNQTISLNTQAINREYFIKLGFAGEEIDILEQCLVGGFRVSVSRLVGMGLSYQDARRINYMYSIVIGKTSIDTPDALSKHLRRMSENNRKVGIYDLPLTKIKVVPRYAVVAGIKDNAFSIFNSNKYSGMDMFYEVVSIYNNKVTVKSKRKPVIKYGQPKKIDGVLEIKELLDDGSILVIFEDYFVRLLNRFIIVASLRRPHEHHGLIEIICAEGTRVYVYAQTLPFNNMTINRSTQRVYDYGVLSRDINDKIYNSLQVVYNSVYGVYYSWEEGNSIYNLEADRNIEGSIEEVIEY